MNAHLNGAGKANFIRKEQGGHLTEIHSGPHGERRVETSFGRNGRMVSYGHHAGYRERVLMSRQGFRQRTYFVGGRSYVRVYHDTIIEGEPYPVYVPAYYYNPGFYAWVGSPWPAPVYWGWNAAPGYGVYFAPAPSYVSPDAWMADYIISQNLQAAYLAQQDAAKEGAAADQSTGPVAPIPPEVKAEYVQEVREQVSREQAQAVGASPAGDSSLGALNPKFAIFTAYSNTQADLNNGQQCDLTPGDFVRRLETTPDSARTIAVSVVAIDTNTAYHCRVGDQVRLQLAVLQDWFNSFVEGEEAAMEAAATNQGKNGFPSGPAVAHVNNPQGQGTPDDPSTLSQIDAQQEEAKRIQAEVQQDVLGAN